MVSLQTPSQKNPNAEMGLLLLLKYRNRKPKDDSRWEKIEARQPELSSAVG